jgi:hypothetical protein
MADTDPGVQSFFPWVRRKLATLPRDTLADGVPGVAAVPVELHVHGGPVVQQQFRLYGPADVIGFDQSQVIRTEPPNLSRNYEPNFLVAVEFDRPDFPWMFTPAAPDALEQLRPWICLVVVRKQDGVNVLA